MKNNFVCPNCDNQITASKSKENGGYYEYYHCKSSCKIRLRKEVVHNGIKELLNKISLDENVKELFRGVLSDVIQSNTIESKLVLKS